MADQIIFTSAVRGIKPGASGYCTVLRSPGIRTALEQALEKISVFEHTKCNQGRTVYTYRQIDIRDKTYYALSRISDAGKDYTGRTNFLAHHLVFEKGELPELSPADILLNWPHWCQQWEGEPREEAVDSQSFAQIHANNPPVRLWKEQAVGVDGAVKLASDTQNTLTLRSQNCSDEILLQLIGEALAVRARFNKSHKYAWTTPFSVGLAVLGSVKSFKCLALRVSDDYALPSVGHVLDLDSALPSEASANEEIMAIAREGQFRPVPKRIPLNSEQSIAAGSCPVRSAKVGLAQSSALGLPRKLKLRSGQAGRANQATRVGSPPSTQKIKKRKWVYLLVCAVVLLLAAGGFWLYSQQPSVNLNYERHYQEMLRLSDQFKQDPDSANFRKQVGDLYRKMYVAKHSSASEMSIDDILQQMDHIYWESISPTAELDKTQHELAFDQLRDFLIKRIQEDKELVSNFIESPDSSVVVDLKGELVDEVKDEVGQVDGALTEPVDVNPLNLDQYEEIFIKTAGEVLFDEIDIKAEKPNYLVVDISEEAHEFGEGLFSKGLLYFEYDKFAEACRLSEDYRSIIPVDVNSYAIKVTPSLRGVPSLFFLIQNDPVEPYILGKFQLKDSSAENALSKVENIFQADPKKIEIRVVDTSQKELSRLALRSGPGPDPSQSGIPLNYDLLSHMVIDSGAGKSPRGVLKIFERWGSEQVVLRLEELIELANASVAGLDQEKQNVYRNLVGAYRDIMKNIKNEDYRIRSYFEEYEAQINKYHKLVKDFKGDSSKRNEYEETLRGLQNREDLSELHLERPEGDGSYVITWKDGDWLLECDKMNIKTPKKRTIIKKSIEPYVLHREAINAYENDNSKYLAERNDFTNVLREWESIKFRLIENDQVIAIVKIK